LDLRRGVRRLLAALLAGLLATGCVYGKTARGGGEENAPAPVRAGETPENLLRSSATLGQGDVFEVRVYKEPDLSSVYRVPTSGTINFPLIGDVEAAGKTPDQVEAEIRRRLEADYLKNAFVSVFVKEFNSKKVFVFGQVNKPGTFPYEDGMRIIQAITLAGGLTKTAAQNSVSVTRIVEGRESRIDVELERIWRGKEPNLLLRPGDIIFVPETLF